MKQTLAKWKYAIRHLSRIEDRLLELTRLIEGSVDPHTGDFVITRYLGNACVEVQRARLEIQRAAEREKTP